MGKLKNRTVETNFPRKDRHCNDIVWLLLFFLFWVAIGFVSWQAVTRGNPWALIYSADSNGMLCGYNNGNGSDFTNKPYVYLLNPLVTPSKSVCVTSCPTTFEANGTVMNGAYCVEGVNATDLSSYNYHVARNECAPFIYPSYPRFSRCYPSYSTSALIETQGLSANISLASNAINSNFDVSEASQQVLLDFGRTWIWILASGGVSCLLSFIWIIIMRKMSGVLISIIILVVLLGLDGLAVFFYFAWTQATSNESSANVSTSNFAREKNIYFGLFIAACVIAGIVNIVFLTMLRRIRHATRIINEASKVLQALPAIMFFPFVAVFLTMALVAAWLLFELFVTTVSSEPNLFGFQYDKVYLEYFQWFVLFGAFWTQQWIAGINHVTIAGAATSFYWTKDKRAIKQNAVRDSFGRVLRYHLGSIAFGALFLPLVSMIRTVFFYAERQVKGSESATKVSRRFCRCCLCCLSCMDDVFRYINKNAYIEIALYGNSFCKSAVKAYQTLTRNSFRLASVDSFAAFLLFMSKLFITSVSGVGGYYWLIYYYASNPLYLSSATVFMIMLVSYAVSELFTSVYLTTIDTIFLSFCEDCENNDGTPDRPYYMSMELQKLTNVKDIKSGSNQVVPSDSIGKELSTRQAFVEEV